MSRPASSTPTTPVTTVQVLVPLVAFVAVIALVVVVLLTRGEGDGAGDGAAATGQAVPTAVSSEESAAREALSGLARREADDPYARGDVDAPVVMIAWSDFQCPFCGRFARETEPALVEEYVETGVLRIEWRDFPYLGEQSTTAALAGRAAAEQDMFWPFHEALYDLEIPPNSGELDAERLQQIAVDTGLDGAAFAATMADPAARQAVEADFTEAQQLGVTGTPTFLVNGVPVVGAQPLESFRQTIEAAAEQAG
ncbi:DsbA family protein [Aquipuribacter sp. MA13-6]|uniref:DsbA family protein n=1 Tax=unclassified Aquipuribacter TaxID=2635084 RepID=UPI003EEC8A99